MKGDLGEYITYELFLLFTLNISYNLLLSFIVFAACSIYIGNHQKELLKEIEREYGA